MSSEAAVTLFRATRTFLGEFVSRGQPIYHGVDKRFSSLDSVSLYLSRGSNVLLSDRNWRSITTNAEDFGTDELCVVSPVRR
jgi:hypothetical protein